MDDAPLVRGFERRGNLDTDFERFGNLQRTQPKLLGECGSLDELHDEIVRPDVVDGADIRVIQRGDGARFALEPVREELGRDLIATSRPSRGSTARYTSPMPPAPIRAFTWYGPSVEPGAKDIGESGQIIRCDHLGLCRALDARLRSHCTPHLRTPFRTPHSEFRIAVTISSCARSSVG